jgi:hypothetical protein
MENGRRLITTIIIIIIIIIMFSKYQRSILDLEQSFLRTRDSVVGIATDYGLDDQGVEFEFRWGQEFSLLYVVQIGSGVHPTSYPMGTGDFFAGGKATGA